VRYRPEATFPFCGVVRTSMLSIMRDGCSRRTGDDPGLLISNGFATPTAEISVVDQCSHGWNGLPNRSTLTV
jgi:hypothetical protein